MRLVLFGAGASYGCGAVQPCQPPLGSELFRVLQRLYLSWRQLPPELSTVFDTNFERGMAKVADAYGANVAPLMQDMAVFFSLFKIAPTGKNLYREIVKTTKGSGIVWASLNYECLLEQAVASEGSAIDYFSRANQGGNDTLVWKLHGSCNFKVAGLQASRGLSFNGIVFEGGIEPIQPSAVKALYKGDTSLYPAMALYAEGKPIHMSPAMVTQTQGHWREAVQSADSIAVIGVYPNQRDEHIWEPLAKSSAKLAYIGNEAAFVKWKKSNGRTGCKYYGRTWVDGFESLSKFLTSGKL